MSSSSSRLDAPSSAAPGAQRHAPGTAPAVPDKPPDTVLDAGALKRLADIDPTGRNGVVGKVLRTYQSSVARLMPQFDTAWQTGDADRLGLVAHTLKSSSATIGAVALAAICAELETMTRKIAASAADAPARAALEPRVTALRAEIAIVLGAVASLLDRQG